MSTPTSNMAMTKPASTDGALISVINTNMDILDIHDHSTDAKGLKVGRLATGARGYGTLRLDDALTIYDSTLVASVAIAVQTSSDLRITPSGSGVIDFHYATVALGGGVAPTLGTIGGSGPAAAAQNSWLKVQVNGTASYIPIWR